MTLCDHLAERLGLALSRGTVRRVLHGLEHRWRRLKDRVAANRLHGTLDDLVAAIRGFFAQLTPQGGAAVGGVT